MAGRPDLPWRLIFLLLLVPVIATPAGSRYRHPNRDAWQQPERVVAALDLRPGMVVADLGAGYGYFTWHLARAVSPGGRVLALDIDAAAMEALRDEARRRGATAVEARVVEADDPGLADRSVDLVFVCNTYHHIHDRVAYFRRLRNALRPGGRVVIIDFYKKPLPVGPPLGHKLKRETVIREMETAGYRLLREHAFLAYQYFLEFVPEHVEEP